MLAPGCFDLHSGCNALSSILGIVNRGCHQRNRCATAKTSPCRLQMSGRRMRSTRHEIGITPESGMQSGGMTRKVAGAV